jgi:hypothetical protein
MSSPADLISCVNDVDPQIGDITSQLVYSVQTGAASTTFQQIPAASPSNSSCTFTIQAPSENTCISREMMVQYSVSFTALAIATTADNGYAAMQFGVNTAWGPFPLMQACQTVQVSLNNSTLTTNLQDVIQPLLKLTPIADLASYDGGCPSQIDSVYADYAGPVTAGSNNNPLSDISTGEITGRYAGRGAFPTSVYYDWVNGAGAQLAVGIQNTSGGVAYSRVTISATITEPLMQSPFMWAKHSDHKGALAGIQNASVTLNLSPTPWNYMLKMPAATYAAYNFTWGNTLAGNNSMWQASNYGAATIGQPQLSAPRLLIKFMSVQPTQVISSRIVTPLQDFPRYVTQQTGDLVADATTSYVSSNLQLAQLPDLFLIFARKRITSQNCGDANRFLTINSVNVNLNNSSGLLSSATQHDLWRLSVQNGSNQSFLEFCGQATSAAVNVAAAGIGSIGSVLCLSPTDLSIPSFLSPGSQGSFNFSVTVNVTNFGPSITAAAGGVELVVLCVNSGVLVTSQGNSSTYSGMLTRSVVLDTAAKPDMGDDARRFVGGGMIRHSMRRGVRSPMMGAAMSGGVMSGGVMSGGRRGALSGLY